MSNELNIEELERLAKAAAPGPWRRQDFRSSGEKNGIDDSDGDVVCASYGRLRPKSFDFIAAANPSAVLALIDRVKKAEADRDDLAAKLKDAEHDRDEFRRVMNGFAEKMAELEGQEPVAWMTANREMTSFVNFHDDDLPLYARQVPAERPVNARLLDVATGKTPHLYEGCCPDYVNGPESRDPDCPACQAIVSAEAQQERLLQDMHDAGLEIDRVMAEPEQKAVRLTEAEIAKALASAGLKPEDYREDGEILPLVLAIESAALRKNGLALED